MGKYLEVMKKDLRIYLLVGILILFFLPWIEVSYGQVDGEIVKGTISGLKYMIEFRAASMVFMILLPLIEIGILVKGEDGLINEKYMTNLVIICLIKFLLFAWNSGLIGQDYDLLQEYGVDGFFPGVGYYGSIICNLIILVLTLLKRTENNQLNFNQMEEM